MSDSLIGWVIFYWLGTVGLTGWLAREKGRIIWAWALVAIALGPLALLTVIGAPEKRR